MDANAPREDLLRTIQAQAHELEEARQTLDAIRTGSVDALIVHTGAGPTVYTLQGADQAYRVLFETLNEGALTLSAEGIILYANRRFARLVGAPLEEVIGCPFVRFIAAPGAPDLAGVVERAARGAFQTEISLRRDGAESVPALLSANAVLVEGRPDLLTVVVTDLTELKGARDALRRAHAELERKVDERTEELRVEVAERKRAEESLRDADRRKDEFLAMLSHELRNPLGAIANAIQVIEKRAPADPMLQRAGGAAGRQMARVRHLLDDLLDVSRITRGAIRIRKERVPLARVVDEAVETVRPLVEECRHRLEVSLPADPVWLDADPVRLGQVFGNLLHNAIKYTDPGGRIRLTAEAEGDRVAVRVKDTGIGIAPDLLPHVFDLFAQADQGLDRARGGLGLGLTLVRRLVAMHGGTVEAHSAGLGQGSEFVVRLPLESARCGVRSAGLPDTGAGTAHSRRVLLVEDNADVAEMTAELLEMEGYEVVAARDGTTALRLAPEFRPEVVLLDLGLPGMDGYEVARRLRRQPGGDALRIIVVTGYGQDEDAQRSRALGLDGHLTKPVAVPALLEALAGTVKE
ncbi:MAG: response regulator [Armatimonadetes bacterium]|nr:response regulator [Armatimonadota bacterium]